MTSNTRRVTPEQILAAGFRSNSTKRLLANVLPPVVTVSSSGAQLDHCELERRLACIFVAVGVDPGQIDGWQRLCVYLLATHHQAFRFEPEMARESDFAQLTQLRDYTYLRYFAHIEEEYRAKGENRTVKSIEKVAWTRLCEWIHNWNDSHSEDEQMKLPTLEAMRQVRKRKGSISRAELPDLTRAEIQIRSYMDGLLDAAKTLTRQAQIGDSAA